MLDSGGDPLPRLERYRASIERSYHRAVKELRMAQKQQFQNEASTTGASGHKAAKKIVTSPRPPLHGYEDDELELDEPLTRARSTQNSAM